MSICVLLGPQRSYIPIKLNQEDIHKKIQKPTFVGAFPELNVFLVGSERKEGEVWPDFTCFHENVRGNVIATATDEHGNQTNVKVNELITALTSLGGGEWTENSRIAHSESELSYP